LSSEVLEVGKWGYQNTKAIALSNLASPGFRSPLAPFRFRFRAFGVAWFPFDSLTTQGQVIVSHGHCFLLKARSESQVTAYQFQNSCLCEIIHLENHD